MCLMYEDRRDREVQQQLRENDGKITVYKVLTYNQCGDLASQMYPYTWKPGWNKSTAWEKEIKDYHKLGLRGSVVNKGFHVFRSLRTALADDTAWCRIVPFTAYEKDFIAGGDWGEACFARLFLSAKNYKNSEKYTKRYWLDKNKK